VTLLFLPFTVGTAAMGFVLFRVMDVVKPVFRPPARGPARWVGIMSDD
jgi:phosphatidylglycerophosphatase A